MLKQTDGPEVLLSMNPYAPGVDGAPQNLRFKCSSKTDDRIRDLVNGRSDFAILDFATSSKHFEAVSGSSNLSLSFPNIGYSVWASLNPSSRVFKNVEFRRYVQAMLFRQREVITALGPMWEKASQLYFSQSVGALGSPWLEEFWSARFREAQMISMQPTQLRVLGSSSDGVAELIAPVLRDLGHVVEIQYADTSQEMFELVKRGDFDILVSRNDFASAELFGSLQTTFSPENPLVMAEEGDPFFANCLVATRALPNRADRQLVYKKIAAKVLEDALIAPLGYCRLAFAHRRGWDLSRLATSCPDLRFWLFGKEQEAL